MDIQVTSSVIAQMQRAAACAFPNEACGILLGEGQSITSFQQASNVHAAPQTHFEIDPQALIQAQREAREGRAQVLGYFHSHPAGGPAPSATDTAMAARDGAIWAIWGNKQIGWWRSGKGGFTALSCAIVVDGKDG